MTKEEWNIGLTPEKSVSISIQKALDWWHSLPIQDLQEGKGWANFCMQYFPNKTECYHLTSDEVFHIYENEQNINLIELYKKECLPNANEPYHYEAEITAGLNNFIEWLKNK